MQGCNPPRDNLVGLIRADGSAGESDSRAASFPTATSKNTSDEWPRMPRKFRSSSKALLQNRKKAPNHCATIKSSVGCSRVGYLAFLRTRVSYPAHRQPRAPSSNRELSMRGSSLKLSSEKPMQCERSSYCSNFFTFSCALTPMMLDAAKS